MKVSVMNEVFFSSESKSFICLRIIQLESSVYAGVDFHSAFVRVNKERLYKIVGVMQEFDKIFSPV